MTPNHVADAINRLPESMRFHVSIMWKLLLVSTMRGVVALAEGDVRVMLSSLDVASENLAFLTVILEIPKKTIMEQIRIELDIPAEDTIDG